MGQIRPEDLLLSTDPDQAIETGSDGGIYSPKGSTLATELAALMAGEGLTANGPALDADAATERLMEHARVRFFAQNQLNTALGWNLLMESVDGPLADAGIAAITGPTQLTLQPGLYLVSFDASFTFSNTKMSISWALLLNGVLKTRRSSANYVDNPVQNAGDHFTYLLKVENPEPLQVEAKKESAGGTATLIFEHTELYVFKVG